MDTVTMANRDIKSLQPIAQQAAQLFLDECKRRNIPIFVTEYHRSQARQNYLYEQGRTRPGNIVTL
jgi:peptidoglycan L-alanyl-D-glutamate endopeptidase CwlK